MDVGNVATYDRLLGSTARRGRSGPRVFHANDSIIRLLILPAAGAYYTVLGNHYVSEHSVTVVSAKY